MPSTLALANTYSASEVVSTNETQNTKVNYWDVSLFVVTNGEMLLHQFFNRTNRHFRVIRLIVSLLKSKECAYITLLRVLVLGH